MIDIAIRVENLGKRYRIGSTAGYKTLRESLLNAATAPFRRLRSAINQPSTTGQKTHYIWAVRNVSFEIGRGQAVGIIGKNGSGKSTLLKILSRITRPTEGRAEILGRVASLLEVGTGFHPELTGRENINLNAAVLGMKRAEVKRKFDAIIDFAGDTVKNYIDTPVKRYSSGMYVRLAFAIAAHLDPEVLLVDEVLAVGDAEFQKKCLGKMGDIAKSGRTVVFVSHNMTAISRLCDSVILLEAGKVKMDGTSEEVIGEYDVSGKPQKILLPLSQRSDRTGDGRIKFINLHWETSKRETVHILRGGGDYRLVLNYICPDGLSKKNVSVSFLIRDQSGTCILLHQTDFGNQNFAVIPAEGYFVCQIHKFPLVSGEYTMNIYVGMDGQPCDAIVNAVQLSVQDGDFYGTGHPGRPTLCKVLVEGSWEVGQ